MDKDTKSKNTARYIQEEKSLSLEDVIKQGVADLKERLADTTRPTTTRIYNAQKYALQASPSTQCIQMVNRTEIGIARAPQLEAKLKEQGVQVHLNEELLNSLGRGENASGVMRFKSPSHAKEGKLSPLICTQSTGIGSKDFSSGMPQNTRRPLPAHLEPLFSAYTSYHEEGHALDDLIDEHEFTNEHLFEDLKPELQRISRQCQTLARVADKPLMKDDHYIEERAYDWLKSINETKQDVYGLMRATQIAQREGYSKEDMLALIDFVHDVRISEPNPEALAHYNVGMGINAVREAVEEYGFGAPQHIQDEWAMPATQPDAQKAEITQCPLHTAVRHWVREEELYMQPEVYVGFLNKIECGHKVPEAFSEQDIQEIDQHLDARAQARQNLRRAGLAVEHIDLSDAQSLNAIIARQHSPEYQALELDRLSTAANSRYALMSLNGKKQTLEGQFQGSTAQYLHVVTQEMPELMDMKPEPTEEVQAPNALSCIITTEDERVFFLRLAREEDETFTVIGRQIPNTPDMTGQISEGSYLHGDALVADKHHVALQAFIHSAEHYKVLNDPDGIYRATQNLELSDDALRNIYKNLNEVFDGEYHYTNCIEDVERTIEIDQDPSRSENISFEHDELDISR